MKFWCSVIFLWVSVFPFAQTPSSIDSLVNLLENPLSDTQRVVVLNEIAGQYSSKNPDKSIQYALEAANLSDKLAYREGVYHAYYHMAWAEVYLGDFLEAKEKFHKAIDESDDGDFFDPSDAYLGLGISFLMQSKYDSAQVYLHESMRKASQFENTKAQASANNYLGVVHDQKGEFIKARAFYNQSLSHYQEINDRQGLGVIYNSLGNNEFMQKNSSSALDYYLQSLKYKEELNDTRGMSKAYNNIGSIYDQEGKREEALGFYYKSLRMKEQLGDKRGLAYTYGNIANIIKNYDSLEKAEAYLHKAHGLYEEIGYQVGLTRTLSMLGAHYSFLGDHPKSLQYYEQSAILSNEIGAMQVYNNAVIKMAEEHYTLGNYEVAHGHATQGVALATERKDKKLLVGAAEVLSNTYDQLGNYKLALETHRTFKQVSDSLTNEEKLIELTRLQADFEFQQKLDSLALAQDKELLRYQAEIQKRRSDQKAIVIVLVIALIALLIIFLFNRKLRKLNNAIRIQNQELGELNKIKSRFLSVISHDLRSPMNVMIGINTLINDHLEANYSIKEDKKLKDIMGYFERSADQVIGLLDNLLNWAMQQEGIMPYTPEVVNLSEAFEENNRAFEMNAEVKKIELNIEVDNDLVVEIDRNSFMAILRNLTANALKFTPSGGKVKLSAVEGHHYTEVVIEDSGVGIASDKVDRLFELNKEKVSRGTAGESGTGLGLKLVQDFVAMNHGEIAIESEPNKGTSFRMRFFNN